MKGIQRVVLSVSKLRTQVSIKLRYLKDYFSSVLFNYTYLPYNQAKHLPIWVSNLHFNKWSRFKGEIIIDAPVIYKRMIKLGVNYNYWYPDGGIRLQLYGTIVFKGKCIIGNNCTFYVNYGCSLTFGENVHISANNSIICESGITIGDNCRIGWNCQMMDTDFHYMKNINTGELTKAIKKPIIIGAHNWFGNSCAIFKGFQTVDFVTIGGGTKCLGRIEEPYTVWGNDGRMIKLKEGWCRDYSNDADLHGSLL